MTAGVSDGGGAGHMNRRRDGESLGKTASAYFRLAFLQPRGRFRFHLRHNAAS